jgi:DNA-binding transcriptional ArsR family regulator
MNELEQRAAMMKALGDPTRLRIFEYLRSSYCSIAVGDTGEVRPVSDATSGPTVAEVCRSIAGDAKINSNISFHLKELRQAWIITMTRKGKYMHCRLNPDVVRQIADYYGGIASEIEKNVIGKQSSQEEVGEDYALTQIHKWEGYLSEIVPHIYRCFKTPAPKKIQWQIWMKQDEQGNPLPKGMRRKPPNIGIINADRRLFEYLTSPDELNDMDKTPGSRFHRESMKRLLLIWKKWEFLTSKTNDKTGLWAEPYTAGESNGREPQAKRMWVEAMTEYLKQDMELKASERETYIGTLNTYGNAQFRKQLWRYLAGWERLGMINKLLSHAGFFNDASLELTPELQTELARMAYDTLYAHTGTRFWARNIDQDTGVFSPMIAQLHPDPSEHRRMIETMVSGEIDRVLRLIRGERVGEWAYEIHNNHLLISKHRQNLRADEAGKRHDGSAESSH